MFWTTRRYGFATLSASATSLQLNAVQAVNLQPMSVRSLK
jgi:hypothetical protein